MLQAIIFDWHGVLDKVTFGGLIEILSRFTHKSKEKILSEIRDIDLSYRLGKITPEDFWNALDRKLQLNQNELIIARTYMLKIDKNVELWKKIPKLKKHFKLAILSDCPLDKARKIRRNVNLNAFNEVFFSAETKISKTDLGSFNKIIRKLRIKPGNCLFVDDKKKHLLNAQKLGFKTCLFKTINDFEQSLNLLK